MMLGPAVISKDNLRAMNYGQDRACIERQAGRPDRHIQKLSSALSV